MMTGNTSAIGHCGLLLGGLFCNMIIFTGKRAAENTTWNPLLQACLLHINAQNISNICCYPYSHLRFPQLHKRCHL
jgi:hypothetical protein